MRRILLTIIEVEWEMCTVHPGAHSGWVPHPIFRYGDEVKPDQQRARRRWGNRSAVDKPTDVIFG